MWKKAGGTHSIASVSDSPDSLAKAVKRMDLGSHQEDEGDSTIRRIQSKKFLVLNLITTLHELEMITEAQAADAKAHCLACPSFDVDQLLSFAPSRWTEPEPEPVEGAPKKRPPGTEASLQSCFDLMAGTAKYAKLPWHTVQTGISLLLRFCCVRGSSDLPSGERSSQFLSSLQFPDRIVLTAACLLVASKSDETLCRLSTLQKGLRTTVGAGIYLMAIPAASTARRAPREPDEAMAAAIRSMEAKVLEALGFDIEVEHAQPFVPLLHLVMHDHSRQADDGRLDHILDLTYELMNFTYTESPHPLSIQYPATLQALACMYLAWCSERDESTETFPWSRIKLKEAEQIALKGLVGYVVAQLKDDRLDAAKGWKEHLFPGAESLPELGGMVDYTAGSISSAKKYQKVEKVCEGTYGTVWVARHREEGTRVAMKLLKGTVGRDGFPYYMLREVLFLRRLNHPNIVAGQEVLVSRSNGEYKFYIVMEYISFDMRDLWSSQLDRTASPRWTVANVKHLTQQLLMAIAYMHKQGLMHRDIKLENLLFDKGVLKVADLGSIRDAGRTELKLTTAVVTLWYRPPELLLGNTLYTSSIDIWSIGCVIVELLVMKALLPGKDVNDMMRWIVATIGAPPNEVWHEHFAHLPKANKLIAALETRIKPRPLEHMLADFSPACLDLVSKMVCYDPDARITAAEALDHPFFSEEPLPLPYTPLID